MVVVRDDEGRGPGGSPKAKGFRAYRTARRFFVKPSHHRDLQDMEGRFMRFFSREAPTLNPRPSTLSPKPY